MRNSSPGFAPWRSPAAREEVRVTKQSNLILRVQPRGARWTLRLSVRGEDRLLDLGGVDDWTIAEARELGSEGGCLWSIPSAFIKSGSKRKTRLHHVVPLPESAWELVQRAMRDSHDPGSEWLFPQFRPKRAGGEVKFMSASTLTRALWLMPGVAASPHDLRRAFATPGEETLGWSRANSKSILDHGEGDQGTDVTAVHYALHNGTHHKWETMTTWTKALEAAVRAAVGEDSRLEDRAWLKNAIDDRRYGRQASGSP